MAENEICPATFSVGSQYQIPQNLSSSSFWDEICDWKEGPSQIVKPYIRN